MYQNDKIMKYIKITNIFIWL